MQSVMTHSFSEVPRAEIPRSSFNRSHGLKTTFDADYLIPVLVDDVVPGDTFNLKMTFFARLNTPFFPIMDNMYMESFFFFVPYRLVWDNWKKMHGEQDAPDDDIDFIVPSVGNGATTDLSSADFFDYMGILPATSVDLTEISALPFRAFNLIWNDWFRDENLQDPLNVFKDNGPDNGTSTYLMMKRGKRHDYFTSALPWPQKGDAVSLPLSGNAPITGIGIKNTYNPSDVNESNLLEADGSTKQYPWSTDMATGASDIFFKMENQNDPSKPEIYADLSQVTAATINDLRLAFQTQKLLERDARGGTRYNELILAHFGVTVPDFRIQRPEFLGGGSQRINVTPVAQTSGTATPAADDKMAQLSGIGTVSGTHGFTKSFVEHGVIIGLVNVRSDITYSQGIDRYWFKQTRYDFFYPVLAQIGEQSVLNGEIFYQNTSADDDVFGYQERYAEYRYKPSRLSGLMRVDHASSLKPWHLSEDFSSLPALGNAFIKSNTIAPLDRAIQIPSEPQFIADFHFDMICARPMPLYGVPGNLDRF